MFDKSREARAQKKNKDVVALIAKQEAALKHIEEKITDVESRKDAVEKILELHGLKAAIQEALRQAANEQQSIEDKRINKKIHRTVGTGMTIGAVGTVVPLIIAAPVITPIVIPFLAVAGLAGSSLGGLLPAAFSINRFEKTTYKKLIKQNPILTYFENILAAQKMRVENVLDDTVKNGNLEKISAAPRFKEAFDSTVSLRDRYAEAATSAAKKALEEKAALEQEPKPATKQIFDPHKYKNIKIN